jgi:hypothetical protein
MEAARGGTVNTLALAARKETSRRQPVQTPATRTGSDLRFDSVLMRRAPGFVRGRRGRGYGLRTILPANKPVF